MQRIIAITIMSLYIVTNYFNTLRINTNNQVCLATFVMPSRIWFFYVERKPINIAVNQCGANINQKMLWTWLFNIHRFSNFINIAYLMCNSKIILLFYFDPRTSINPPNQVNVYVFGYICLVFVTPKPLHTRSFQKDSRNTVKKFQKT